ncbi:MAG: hypothetical protein K2Y29_17965 [Beijerinckiaceae bacterium]|nr:hypothetical protein [Beijerinckiaceae bacterium]
MSPDEEKPEEDQREQLRRMLAFTGIDATTLSRRIGKSKDFIRDYLAGRKQSMSKDAWAAATRALYDLRAESQAKLVRTFDPDESSADEHFDPSAPTSRSKFPPGAIVELAAQGGLGSGQVIAVSYHRQGQEIVSQDEIKGDYWHFPADFSRFVLGAPADKMVVIECNGDSMEPTIMSGERVWVNTLHQTASPDGIYAIRDALGSVVVKRLELIAGAPPRIRIISDNPKHTSQELAIDDVPIIGKVKCGLRMF